jgi:hypothetical protein
MIATVGDNELEREARDWIVEDLLLDMDSSDIMGCHGLASHVNLSAQ